MSASDKAPLRMVTCGACDTKVFIPGDLPPLSTVPCSKCGHPIMMPLRLRQFELRSVIASGGMSKLDDIHQVRKTGAASVVIGKAIYEGAFTIEEALTAAAARGR